MERSPQIPITVPYTIRYANFSDLPSVARTYTLGFWNDVLFGRLIHPHRHKFPADNDIYWLKRLQCSYWDWSQIFLVATTSSPPPYPELTIAEFENDSSEKSPLWPHNGERIIGAAQWSRSANLPSTHRLSNHAFGRALAWWSPLRLLQPIFQLYWSLLTHFGIQPNRAADQEKEDIIERSYGFLDHIWSADNHRDPVWYLESIAVLPEYQYCGVGRELVRWGLDKAEEEGICCSVISAEGKERFYQRCGFDVGPIGWSGEGEGNPLVTVPGGLVFVREARDVREGLIKRPPTQRTGKIYGGVEVDFS
jgi:GNAT superfamily N-acetyltransferase